MNRGVTDRPAASSPRFRLADDILFERLSDGAYLFSDTDQQVCRLNPSGAMIAGLLRREATRTDLIAALVDEGIGPTTASEWVSALLRQMSDASMLEMSSPPPAKGEAEGTAAIAGMRLRLGFGSQSLLEDIAPAFAVREGDCDPVDHHYRLAGSGELVAFARDGGTAMPVSRDMAAVRLKAAILDDVLECHADSPALHAACVIDSGGAVLLLGSPGAGKTMLTLALLQQGFRFGSDDVTLVTGEAQARTIGLPAAIKEPAWPLAARLGCSLDKLAVHRRADGQRLRFFPVPGTGESEPVNVRAIVKLQRTPGSDAMIDAMSDEDALVSLFAESRSASGRCSKDTMRSMAKLVRDADCIALRYAEADEAAARLSRR